MSDSVGASAARPSQGMGARRRDDAPRHFVLERTVTAVVLLAGAAASATVFLVSVGAIAPEAVIADEALRSTLLGFAKPGSPISGGTGLLAALLGLAFTALLARQIVPGSARPGRTNRVDAIILSAKGGRVLVGAESIARLAEAAAHEHGVAEVNVGVKIVGPTQVKLRVDAGVLPGEDLAEVGRILREATQDAVQRLAGATVVDVAVRLEVLSYDALREVA